MTSTETSDPNAETTMQPDQEPEAKAEAQPETGSDAGANQAKQTEEATADAEDGGVFSGWGFDVNAVAGNINIGGLFTSPDKEEAKREAEQGEQGADISAAAANIANVAATEIDHASKAAQETFGKAAEELGKGWGTLNSFLDDMLTPNIDGSEEVQEKDMVASFHSLFPEIDAEDQVIDHFECALVQKYRCYLNNATPEKTYPLRGRLYISTTHLAMYVTDDGGAFGKQPFGIAIAFADVGKILKQKGANAMLKLVTKSQQSYIVADFESDAHFSGALSLIEHMKSGSAQPPQPKEPTKEAEGSTEKPAAG